MFAAAMLFAAPNIEISIYSTCKRISQKLLRNVIKFLELIYIGMGVPKFKVIRENMEELVIRGPESIQDIRIVNSYPSKVPFLITATIIIISRRGGWRRKGGGEAPSLQVVVGVWLMHTSLPFLPTPLSGICHRVRWSCMS